MAPQPPLPAPPPLSTNRPAFERAPLGSGPKRPARWRPSPAAPASRRRRPSARRRLFLSLRRHRRRRRHRLSRPQSAERSDPPEIAEQVKARTGRDLTVAGPASFMFYPNLGVSLGDVSLSGPPGMDGTLVRMQSLDVSVKALTVLSQQVEINSVILRKPVFDFHIDKTGRNNWEFAATAASPVRFAELQTPGTRPDVEPIRIAATDDAGDAPAPKNAPAEGEARRRRSSLERRAARGRPRCVSPTTAPAKPPRSPPSTSNSHCPRSTAP